MIYPLFIWQYHAQRQPDSTAIFLNLGRPLTWANLEIIIDRIAASFIRQGVTEGDGIMLRGNNSFQLLTAYLAGLQIGARVMPTNPKIPTTVAEQLILKTNIGFYWSADEEVLPACALQLDLTRQKGILSPHVPYDPDRIATLTLTSGSSGLPKAVAHTIAAHGQNAEGVAYFMTFRNTDNWLLSLPLYHVSGQGIIWRWLVRGARLVLREDTSLIESLRDVTHASLVPTQLKKLLDAQNAELHVQKILLGGSVIPNELVDRAEARGVQCFCGYGLTEMASTVCAKRANHTSGVGAPLPDREVKTLNHEILLRGAGLASGYWQDGKLVPLTDDEGWFHTRDRGEFIDGELHVSGRLDHMFISGGENVQPEDIERVLIQYPNVDQVLVTPIADALYGARPIAVIEGAVSFEELREWVKDKLAPFQQPTAYYAMPAALKKEGIKVSRAGLSEWVESSGLGAPSSVSKK